MRSWDDLASRFCKKYFQHEEKVTTTQLNNTRQKQGEDPVDFVRRFRDLALDCYDEKDEEALVEICISNIVADYRVYLENIGIRQFSRLLEVVRKTSMSVKPARTWRSDKNETYQALAIDDEPSNYCLKQTIDEDPLPKRRGKEVAAVITCSDDLLDDDELCHSWRNDPKPLEAMWEPCGNMENAYWCKYLKHAMAAR
ncbi:unnamed protein product [Prunus armeniaca]